MQRTDSAIVRADLVIGIPYISNTPEFMGFDVVMNAEKPLLVIAEGGSSIGVLTDWVVVGSFPT